MKVILYQIIILLTSFIVYNIKNAYIVGGRTMLPNTADHTLFVFLFTFLDLLFKIFAVYALYKIIRIDSRLKDLVELLKGKKTKKE